VCCFAQGQENEPPQAQKEIEQLTGRDCARELRLAGVSGTKEGADGKMVTIKARAELRELVAKVRAGNAPARKRAQSNKTDRAGGLEPQKTLATTLDLADVKAAVEVAKQKIVTQKTATQKIFRAVPAPHMPNVVDLAEALCTPGLPTLLISSHGSLSGARQRARSLGLMPASDEHPLANQVLEVPKLQAFEKVPGSMTSAELLPALVASIDHYSTQWITLGREQRVQWLAGQLQHMHNLSTMGYKFSSVCRENHAAWAQMSRLRGFSSESNNKKRSNKAHIDLIFCHDTLTRSNGLGGHARTLTESQQRARRPCGSHKVPHAVDVLWNRERDALKRHLALDSIEPDTDMLATLHMIPGARDAGEGPDGYRRASSQSMDILRSTLAIELNAPVLALHGEAPKAAPLLTAGQLVNVTWGTPEVSTPEQVVNDAMKAVSIVKNSLRDEQGKLHFDDSGHRLQGIATFGPAQLANNQTLTVYTRSSNHSENHNPERANGVLKTLKGCGPAFAQMVAALLKGRDSLPIAERILRLDFLFYMTDDDASAFANGFWHARC
jgi:hypothetical protein